MSQKKPDAVGISDDAVRVVEDALQSLWGVVNELSRLKPTEKPYYRVAVFGSARIRAGHPLYDDVRELASRLSAMGADIVTGGGPGIMQAANEGENAGDPENRTRSIGVRIELPFEQGANPFVEKLFVHRTFFSRLHQFVRLSDAYVILGGGIGTTLETLMIWQLLQVRHLHDVPLIFVGPMWSDLVDWARRHMLTSDPPLANPADLDIPTCVSTPGEVCELLAPRIAEFERQRAERDAAPASDVSSE